MEPLIVTLDGPAGSGKSTVARLLAKRLGVAFLDTGAMYRGLAVACLQRGVDPAAQPEQAAALAESLTMRFDWHTDPPRLYVGDQDVTDRLRDGDVTGKVSDVASIARVREILVQAQRQIGQEHPRLVTEGRDQGSVVFPQAQAKFYLDAAPHVRARRRAEELRQAGRPADEAEILEQILHRDRRDAGRTDGPLTCPQDAIRIDTTDMTLQQVVEHLLEQTRQRLDNLAAAAARRAGA